MKAALITVSAPLFPRRGAAPRRERISVREKLMEKRSEHVPRREHNAVVKVKVHSPADDDRERRGSAEERLGRR